MDAILDLVGNPGGAAILAASSSSWDCGRHDRLFFFLIFCGRDARAPRTCAGTQAQFAIFFA